MTQARKFSSNDASNALIEDAPRVVDAVNAFARVSFMTRGGRLGSGMGSLIEALWIYYMNAALQNESGEARECELAWMPDHQPADFACVFRNKDWSPETREGELLRIEAKSMNLSVDEAKGHFTNLAKETSDPDLLLVVLWKWESDAGQRVWPKIVDYFLGRQSRIIELRDTLHLARGGSFVDSGMCPDGCLPDCAHVGEPLNAKKKRERKSGPAESKPANIEFAANFGGLLRMLKTNNEEARQAFRQLRRDCDVCHEYISFVHRNFPKEERNQYSVAEWRALAASHGLEVDGMTGEELQKQIALNNPDYRNALRVR